MPVDLDTWRACHKLIAPETIIAVVDHDHGLAVTAERTAPIVTGGRVTSRLHAVLHHRDGPPVWSQGTFADLVAWRAYADAWIASEAVGMVGAVEQIVTQRKGSPR